MNLHSYLENLLSKKTILLYHGLNSNPASDKKKYLNENGINLIQGHHDYKKEFDDDQGKKFMIEQESIARSCDILMGISFGGYVAYMLACRLKKSLILINPAINRDVTKTSIKKYDYRYENMKPKKIEYFYGENDKAVIFNDQKNIIDHSIADFIKIKNMEHRVPIKFFKEICQQSKLLKEG